MTSSLGLGDWGWTGWPTSTRVMYLRNHLQSLSSVSTSPIPDVKFFQKLTANQSQPKFLKIYIRCTYKICKIYKHMHYIYIYLQKPQLGTRPFRGFYPPVKLKNESSVSKQSCPPVANVQTSSCQTRWSSIFLSFLLCSSNTSVGRSEDPLVAAL